MVTSLMTWLAKIDPRDQGVKGTWLAWSRILCNYQERVTKASHSSGFGTATAAQPNTETLVRRFTATSSVSCPLLCLLGLEIQTAEDGKVETSRAKSPEIKGNSQTNRPKTSRDRRMDLRRETQ
jgi:hypothetical protein